MGQFCGYPRAFPSEITRQGLQSDRSPTSHAEDTNEWNYNSTYSYVSIGAQEYLCLFSCTWFLYVISKFIFREARVRGRFTHCATSLEIPISIPGGFLGKFPGTYSFCLHPVALEATQTLKEIPLRIKCGRSLELANLPSWSWPNVQFNLLAPELFFF